MNKKCARLSFLENTLLGYPDLFLHVCLVVKKAAEEARGSPDMVMKERRALRWIGGVTHKKDIKVFRNILW